jgi:hypothetical protein
MAGDFQHDASKGTCYVIPQSAFEDLRDVRDTLASIARFYLGAARPAGWPVTPDKSAELAVYFRRLSLDAYQALEACSVLHDRRPTSPERLETH